MSRLLFLSFLAISQFTPGPDTVRAAGNEATPGSPPEKAVCQVCFMIGEGATPEKVKASTVFKGTPYYFCSRECQKIFETDPAGFVLSEFPSTAPSFSVRDLEGNALDRGSFNDRILLLDFWATWCKPCVKTMPALAALQQKYKDKLVVLGISIDENPETVRKYVAKHAPGYQIAVDDTVAPAWQVYRVKVVPTAFLIDAGGTMAGRWVGPSDGRRIGEAIDSLLALPDQRAK